MADVLLAHPYFILRDPKQAEKMKPYPPLATLLSAAVLREGGREVELFDAMLAPGLAGYHAALARQPRIMALVEDGFNFLTKMCTLQMREAAAEMVAAARAAGCRVVVNGSDATDHPGFYLDAGADAVLLGDPEGALPALVDRWLSDPSAIPGEIGGLVLRGPDGGTRRTGPRPRVRDLDALPLPAWDLVDAAAYRDAWRRAHGRFSWNMVTSRGCPFGCNWCAKPLFGRRYDQRSAARAADEVQRLRETVAPDHLWFADDIFGLTPAWIEAFAGEIQRRGVRTPFSMQTRTSLVDDRTAAALAAAGAEEVWLGVESGSQRVLEAMEKGSRVDQARTATRALRRHGVRAGWFIQLGYLGEEWSDLIETRDLIRDERPDDIGVSVSYPLPGTRFHEMVRAQLGEKRNWAHTDDLDMLFHGTYSAEIYRQIRDVLHLEVRDGRPLEEEWAELAAAAEAELTAGAVS